jgi:NAD-dependent DNA ligase
MEVWVVPEADAGRQNLSDFLEALAEGDLEAIQRRDPDGLLGDADDVAHSFESPELSWQEREGVFTIRFVTFPSLEEDMFAAFLSRVAPGIIEGMVYDTRVGEYSFFDEASLYMEYDERTWRYIDKPVQFETECIAFTGTMRLAPREALEELAEDLGAEIQATVDESTTLLVAGVDPDEALVSKAGALGVRVMDEASFSEAAENY